MGSELKGRRPVIPARGPQPKRQKSAALLASALIAVNLMFGLAGYPGSGGVAPLFLPSPEAVLLVSLVCLHAWLRLPGRRALAVLLALMAVFLLLFRLADRLVPLYFDRPFSLLTDVRYVSDLYALMRDTRATWLFVAGLAALAAGVTGTGVALAYLFGFLHGSFRHPHFRYSLAGIVALAAVLELAGPLPFLRASSLPRVAEEMGRLLHARRYREQQQELIRRQPVPRQSHPLAGLAGRDVHLIIVESYGYTAHWKPAHRRLLLPALEGFRDRLAAAGFSVVSGFLDSPAFGGNSWLADSTLDTGIRIHDQEAYEALLRSSARTIADYFREAGYRTVLAMPAMTGEWPEGDFFGFEQKYYFRDFGYRGRTFKWAPMTDQYALDFIRRRELGGSGRPLFVQYVLISSHYPFNLVPRHFQDWSVLGDGRIYDRQDAATVVPIKAGNQTAGAEGYAAVIGYVLGVVSDYLARFIPGDALIVVLGDHQPYSGITGKGRPRSVPVHVICRDPTVLEPFLRRGYRPGVFPDQPLPHPGMEAFLPGLLEDFAGQPFPAGGAAPHGAR